MKSEKREIKWGKNGKNGTKNGKNGKTGNTKWGKSEKKRQKIPPSFSLGKGRGQRKTESGSKQNIYLHPPPSEEKWSFKEDRSNNPMIHFDPRFWENLSTTPAYTKT